MSNRGRGPSTSFNVEALGISKGDSLPVLEHPPPSFPPLVYKPVQLIPDEELNYLVSLKQEYRTAVKYLPFYYIPQEKKRDIERYSDKYKNSHQDQANKWNPDMSYFPDELKIKTKKRHQKVNISTSKFSDAVHPTEKIEDKLKKLEEHESHNAEGSEEESANEAGSGEEEVAEHEGYDEEEMEEETDYILPYFDNGEGLDDEDDALDDGPTYS